MLADLVADDDIDASQLTMIRPFGDDLTVVRLLTGRLGIACWRGGRPGLFVADAAPVAPVVVARHLVDDHPPALHDETWQVTFCELSDCEQARHWLEDAADTCAAIAAGASSAPYPSTSTRCDESPPRWGRRGAERRLADVGGDRGSDWTT